jgi:NitT/TauT family transport system ATP-binding protein
LSEGDLMLTGAGKHFAHLETDARKKLFAEHLINYVPIMGLIRRVLDERPSQRRPLPASATNLRITWRKIRQMKR